MHSLFSVSLFGGIVKIEDEAKIHSALLLW